MRIILLIFLAAMCLISSCALIGHAPEASSVLAGIKDMHLSGFRGYWAPGMIPSTQASHGRFFLDYDLRKAEGSGTALLVEGGKVRWKIQSLEVISPKRAERGVFHRLIVLHGEFVIDGGVSPGLYHRALVHVTHFESAPPWMCLHVIRDEWDLRSNAQAVRYTPPAGTLYFHATDGP